MTEPRSQQVDWYTTYCFVEALLSQANCGPLPWAGTPAWQAMADSDPRKLLALAQFGVHWALRVEFAQQAQAQAAKEISAAADWSALARRVRNSRGNANIPRRREVV